METTGGQQTTLPDVGIEEEGGSKEGDLPSDEEGMRLDKPSDYDEDEDEDDTSEDERESEAEIQRLEEQVTPMFTLNF